MEDFPEPSNPTITTFSFFVSMEVARLWSSSYLDIKQPILIILLIYKYNIHNLFTNIIFFD